MTVYMKLVMIPPPINLHGVGLSSAQGRLYLYLTFNGVRILNFATSNDLIVSSTIYSHLKIHKYTWTSD